MGVKEELKELEEKVVKGLEIAYEKMLDMKRAKNSPLVISENGKVKKVKVDK